MDPEEFERFAAMASIARARLDALESAFATALAIGDTAIAVHIEAALREAGEEHLSSPAAEENEALHATAQASVRLAEMVAAAMGSRRASGRGSG